MTARWFAVALCATLLGACAHGEKSLQKFEAAHAGAQILPVEFVEQNGAADCGAAALTSVARFWGADLLPGTIVAQWAPANPAFGYSVGELHDVSAKLGLASSRLLEEPDYVLGLLDDGLPVIAPVAKPYQRDIFDYMLASMVTRLVVSAFVGASPTVNHYVVVLGADAQTVYFLDPQDGYHAMARNEFLTQWGQLTQKFMPDRDQNVAAFVAWREPAAAGLTEPSLYGALAP